MKFKTLSLALLLGMALTAQGQWRYLGGPLTLPKSDLNLAEVVDILADYSLKHQEKIVGGPYAGLVDVTTKEIFVSDQYDQMYRRQTVIHELLHVYYLRRFNIATGGYEAGETAVETESTRIYEELFTPRVVDHCPIDYQCDAAGALDVTGQGTITAATIAIDTVEAQ